MHPLPLCAQLLGAAWIEWHKIQAGEWWTAGIVRRLPVPASIPPCSANIISLGSFAISSIYQLI